MGLLETIINTKPIFDTKIELEGYYFIFRVLGTERYLEFEIPIKELTKELDVNCVYDLILNNSAYRCVLISKEYTTITRFVKG